MKSIKIYVIVEIDTGDDYYHNAPQRRNLRAFSDLADAEQFLSDEGLEDEDDIERFQYEIKELTLYLNSRHSN